MAVVSTSLLRVIPELARYNCIVGLCGGIASGKSHARAFLASQGCVCVDADALAHAAYAPGMPAFTAIVDAFSDRVVAADGNINRRELGSIIFSDASARQCLNSIVWPAVAKAVEVELQRGAATFDGSQPLIGVVEAALMIEAGWATRMDELWATEVAPEVAVSRLLERDGMTVDAAHARLAAQMSNEARRVHATVCIDTSGSKEDTRARLLQQLERCRTTIARATST